MPTKTTLLQELVTDSVNRCDNWITQNGWAGYDPYDIKGHPLLIKPRTSWAGKVGRKVFGKLELLSPLILRWAFNIQKEINAKAMGLFAQSYLKLYQHFQREDYLAKAEDALDWLSCNYNKDYSGMCWGYPFDWQSKVFIPRGTPSSVVTSIIGDAYWDFYQYTNEDKYLDVCISICEFFVNDLLIDKLNDQNVCFSYTPLDNFHVNNANLFVAEFLTRIGKHVGNDKFVTLGLMATNYTLNEQNDDGSIYYWGKDQEQNGRIDHYHSGFEIRKLYSIWKLTNSDQFQRAVQLYYSFYLKNLFTDSWIPKMTPTGFYPVNIHSCAEAILCTSSLINDFPEGKDHLINTVKWTIANMQTTQGWYLYRIDKLGSIKWKSRIPFMRWGQAWMLRALSQVCTIENL